MPSPNGNAEASVSYLLNGALLSCTCTCGINIISYFVSHKGGVAGGVEVDGKSSDGKEKSPIKRSKGSLGSLNMITGKSNNELGKTSGASANGVSQRYTSVSYTHLTLPTKRIV